MKSTDLQNLKYVICAYQLVSPSCTSGLQTLQSWFWTFSPFPTSPCFPHAIALNLWVQSTHRPTLIPYEFKCFRSYTCEITRHLCVWLAALCMSSGFIRVIANGRPSPLKSWIIWYENRPYFPDSLVHQQTLRSCAHRGIVEKAARNLFLIFPWLHGYTWEWNCWIIK
jgi:hypothetical protein